MVHKCDLCANIATDSKWLVGHKIGAKLYWHFNMNMNMNKKVQWNDSGRWNNCKHYNSETWLWWANVMHVLTSHPIQAICWSTTRWWNNCAHCNFETRLWWTKFDLCAYVATDSNDCWSSRRCTIKWFWKTEITIPNITLVNKYDVCAYVATDSSDLLQHWTIIRHRRAAEKKIAHPHEILYLVCRSLQSDSTSCWIYLG